MTQIDKTQLKGDDNTLHFFRGDNELAPAMIAHKTSHQDGGSDEIDVTGLTGLLATPQTPAAHYQAAESINSGTLDGARLTGPTTTKRGGMPPIVEQLGKFLKDSGMWAYITASDIVSGVLDGDRLPSPTTTKKGGVVLDGNAAHFLNGAGGCTTPAGGLSRSIGTSTGTGSQQTIAHGLGAIPASLSIVLLSTGVTSIYVWADATNIYPNVTSGKGYKWMASL